MGTARKSSQTKPVRTASQPQLPDAYHQLHSLLDTVRTFATQEDEICTLLAAIKRSGALEKDVRRDLTKLLNMLPTDCLKQELSALRLTLQHRAA